MTALHRPSRPLTALCCTLAVAGAVAVAPSAPAVAQDSPFLTVVDSFQAGEFDDGGAEIPTFDPKTGRFFVTNGSESAVDVLELRSGGLVRVAQLDVPAVTSIDVSSKGVLAVAVPSDPEQAPGQVRQYSTKTLELRRVTTVGALPDMLTYTADGKQIVVANEGEPSGYRVGDVDPVGSISVIDAASGKVRTAGFTEFNGQQGALTARGVRISGPGASVAQDLEPEYVALSADGRTAYVALQENNALALVDLKTATVTDIRPLGLKDHAAPGNGFDASDRDSKIDIRSRPTKGMFMPDGIDAYTAADGREYVVTANEGDGRDYPGFTDEARVRDVVLDPAAFPNAAALQRNSELGRLRVTTTSPRDAAGRYTALHTFGARSFSIRDASGALVFDSGDSFEQITAEALPLSFNSNNDNNASRDSRSDDKGPEPEGVELGEVDGRTYAFIGLERVGGIMVFDVTTARSPVFVDYVVTRDFGVAADSAGAGDLGPEGLSFVPSQDSPTGKALLVVASEVSGTTTVFTVG